MSKYIVTLESIAGMSLISFDSNGNRNDISSDEDSGDDDAEDRQIQMSCCANMRFKQCVMSHASRRCKPVERLKFALSRTSSVSSARMAQRFLERSMRETMNDLSKTLDSMALTGPEFICAGVTETYCRRHFDRRFGLRSLRRRTRSSSKSILPAMIRIYSSKGR